MTQVLITVSKGIIELVIFFNDPKMAVQALSKYVKNMNVEYDDAAVYDSEGLIANAKHFLDDNDEYMEHKELLEQVSEETEKSIFIIGNPDHCLGFMVASPDDPLGYHNPVAALADLGQMRKDYGSHLNLYRVMPVDGPIAYKTEVEKYNADCDVDDFDYSLIEEHLL